MGFRIFLLQRLLSLILVLFGGSIAIFAILRFMPGDPVVVMLGFEYNAVVVEEMRRELGLDKPPPIQYLEWIIGVLQGDLGRSYFLKRDVTDLLFERFPTTLMLAFASLLVALFKFFPCFRIV